MLQDGRQVIQLLGLYATQYTMIGHLWKNCWQFWGEMDQIFYEFAQRPQRPQRSLIAQSNGYAGVWILWSKKKIVFSFQKENGNTFTLLIIFIVKSLQKEQNSTNLLLWPPICRNKPAITPKWFNSLDTNFKWKQWIHYLISNLLDGDVVIFFTSGWILPM